MYKVKIKRTKEETKLNVKTSVPDEKPFIFKSLSPTITREHIRLILPRMIDCERDKRNRKAYRKEELTKLREEKAAKAERFKEVPNE